jgi:hypothetical protein
MLSIDAYQGDWQLQLESTSTTSSQWRIIVPSQPDINELAVAQDCLMQQQINSYKWLCAVADGLWMLQREQQQWWLTFWSSRPTAARQHWLGQQLSLHKTELYQLAVVDSRFSAQQLFDYSKFKWGQRDPLLKEIGHGQFHLRLQNPLEELFIVQLAGSSLVLQFRQLTDSERAGNN